MPLDQYQTIKDVADRLKVAEATVRHWVKLGHLRAINIGKGWRIANTDLNEFLRLHQTAPRQQSDGPNVSDSEGKP